jgi:hypothetical protein
MSSPNPGISAAGEAAGSAALNPLSGPAAIGGMVVPGESEPDPPVPQRVRSAVEDQLTAVVSDIAKMASVVGALSLSLPPERAPSREKIWGRSGGGPYAAGGGAAEPVQGGSTAHTSHGLGATGAVTTGIGGYANVPAVSGDTQRQATGRYRA